MLTNKTDSTVNTDSIIPLYPGRSICLFNINKNETERSAVIESEDIKLALAIIFPTVVILELAPICALILEKIRMLTNRNDSTVNTDSIIPLYPGRSICLFNINKNETERSAVIESEDIKLALAIIFPTVAMLGKIILEFTNNSTAIKIITPTITEINVYSRINCPNRLVCLIIVPSDRTFRVIDCPSSFFRAGEEGYLPSISCSNCKPFSVIT